MWFIYALSASVLWGLTYVLGEQIYKKISVITSLSLATFIAGFVMLIAAYLTGHLVTDYGTLTTNRRILGLSIAEAFCLIAAELLIGFSIANKNATLAGLIEISYPIFIVIFSYLLFKDNQFNVSSSIGGLLIFVGIFIIYFFNK